jgi:hypothetical protein
MDGLSLYRNNGDGAFTDVSIESGLYRGTNGSGSRPAITRTAAILASPCAAPVSSAAWSSFGAITATARSRMSASRAASPVGVPSFTCSWCDYDLGRQTRPVRLHQYRRTVRPQSTPHKLFHNNGDGTFTEVAAQAGIVFPLAGIGHTWGDYNNDGYPDLFLSNAIGEPQLFRNNGDGTFTDVSAESGLGCR